MTHLNSLIIEGWVAKKPKYVETSKDVKFDAQKILSFSILNEQTCKANGKFKKLVSHIDVEAFGSLAERLNGMIEKGREVRVVGRIKQKRWKDSCKINHSEIVVVAEHIELKPNLLKEVEEWT